MARHISLPEWVSVALTCKYGSAGEFLTVAEIADPLRLTHEALRRRASISAEWGDGRVPSSDLPQSSRGRPKELGRRAAPAGDGQEFRLDGLAGPLPIGSRPPAANSAIAASR